LGFGSLSIIRIGPGPQCSNGFDRNGELRRLGSYKAVSTPRRWA